MPSFHPLGGITGRSNAATLFEIRLENEFIVLRGSESEAMDQLLKGTVVLCLQSPLKVEGVHLGLTGTMKVGWAEYRPTASGTTKNKYDKTVETLNHKWDLFPEAPGSKTMTLEPGNYVWPFEFVVPGSIYETVEGLPDSHLKYKLKATVARSKLAHDLHAYKTVRMVRTLDPSALEFAHAMTVENVWPNKIEYQIVIPQKAIIFGTHIDVNMRFTSLLKGLEMGMVRCVLVEDQEFSLQSPSNLHERTYSHTRKVASWEFQVSREEHYTEMMESGQDGWELKEKLPLPKSLAKCLQNVEIHGIRIRHKVKFVISLLNPDGHTSELRATLPVTIFISPNIPLDEEGCLVDQTPISAQTIADLSMHAPPLYGEHILDQLYADVHQSGLQTPHLQSGVHSPLTAQSRNGSSDNLASLNRETDPIHPDVLTSRLQDLDANPPNPSLIRRQLASGTNTPRIPHSHHDSGYFGGHSAEHSNPLSRRTSEEDHSPQERRSINLGSGRQSPQHLDYSEFGDLSKVPSYSTAVRSSVRGLSSTDAVPNYETAISTPTTPLQGFVSPASTASPGGAASTEL